MNIKRLIRKYGGSYVQNLLIWFLRSTGLNNRIILFSGKKAEPNKVNINYWSDKKNIGDCISPIIVDFVASQYNIDTQKVLCETRHLYAIGSIITAGCQDCTIWGSGLLNSTILSRLKGRNLDIRSVRGPITRLILMDYGFDVPEVYGDPAILMPLLYNPNVQKKYKVSVITHMNELIPTTEKSFHRINVITDDYSTFVKEIKASELIISSSLHGVILAESYGVPAILLKPKAELLKYYDYYYSTNRYDFPIAENVEEAMRLSPPEIPDYTEMRNKLLAVFPADIWI